MGGGGVGRERENLPFMFNHYYLKVITFNNI